MALKCRKYDHSQRSKTRNGFIHIQGRHKMVERLLQFSMQTRPFVRRAINSVKNILLCIIGGVIVTMSTMSFVGFACQSADRISEVFGYNGLMVLISVSYVVGWGFFRAIDRRIRMNSRPKMIHYTFEKNRGVDDDHSDI